MSSAVRAGSAFVEVGLKSKVEQGVRQVTQQISGLSQKLAVMGGATVGIGLAITGALGSSVAHFTAAGAALQRLATQTGTSVSELSALKFAAEQSGAEVDDISGALEELNIRMGEVARDGTGPAAEAFKTLGLSAQELGKMTPIDRLKAVGEALSGVQDAAARGFLADEIIGGDAFKILPLLAQGREGIEEMMQAARELGVVMTSEDAAAADKFSVAIGQVRSVIAGIVNQIGAALAPAFTQIADVIRDVGVIVVGFVRENRQLVVMIAGVGAGLVIAGGALLGFAGALAGIGAIIIGAKVAIAGIGTVIGAILSPVGLTIIGIVALYAAIVAIAVQAGVFAKVWEPAKAAMMAIWEVIKQTGDTLRKFLSLGDYSSALKTLWVGIQAAFWTGAAAISGIMATMWEDAWTNTKLFFSTLLEGIWNTFKSIPSLIIKAISGSQSIGQLIADSMSGDSGLTITSKLEVKAAAARAELEKLQSEANSKVAARDASNAEALASTRSQNPASPSGNEGANPASPSGNEGANPASPSGNEGASNDESESVKAAQSRIAALREEITVMQMGEDAAERHKLALEGVRPEVIKEIETLQNLRRETKLATEAKEKLATEITESIGRMGEAANEAGAGPMQTFAEQVEQIRAAVADGKLTQDQGDKAIETFKGDADGRVQATTDEGKQLTDSLRTPFEVMQDELKRIDRLRASGAIDDTTASRATEAINKDFGDSTRTETDNAKNTVAMRGSQAALDTISRTRGTDGAAQFRDAPWAVPLVENARMQLTQATQMPARLAEILRQQNQELVDTKELERIGNRQVASIDQVVSAVNRVEANTRSTGGTSI